MLFRGFIIKNNPPAEGFSQNKSLKRYVTQRSKHLSRDQSFSCKQPAREELTDFFKC